MTERMTERVLVAYGSERGGTAGIAEAIGAALREDGMDVDVKPAGEVADISSYDAVVLGGALYMLRWHADARRFGRRHSRALRERKVWLFSSGPLDQSADQKDIRPVRFVAELSERVGALGHATFGGRLEPDAKGLIAGSMAKKMAGDFRDFERIEAWAHGIARELGASARQAGQLTEGSTPGA
jgi:menaquinone-dependent protoporphyrinogen oxidase